MIRLVAICFVAMLSTCSGVEPEDAEATPSTTAKAGANSSTDLSDTSATGQAESRLVELEVSFFNWTETDPPSEQALVVVEDFGSWTPDLEFGGDGHSFGDFEIGVPGTILIYPDGPGSKQMRVTFVMSDGMISGSAQALTHIEVFDSEVVVYGQAVADFEQVFDR